MARERVMEGRMLKATLTFVRRGEALVTATSLAAFTC